METESTGCPHCGCKHIIGKCEETRWSKPNGQVLVIRARRCRNCHKRYTTQEVAILGLKLPSSHDRKKFHETNVGVQRTSSTPETIPKETIPNEDLPTDTPHLEPPTPDSYNKPNINPFL